MEKISWVDKISNEEVLQSTNEARSILDSEKMQTCVVRSSKQSRLESRNVKPAGNSRRL